MCSQSILEHVEVFPAVSQLWESSTGIFAAVVLLLFIYYDFISSSDVTTLFALLHCLYFTF